MKASSAEVRASASAVGGCEVAALSSSVVVVASAGELVAETSSPVVAVVSAVSAELVETS